MREYSRKVDTLMAEKKDREKEAVNNEESMKQAEQQQNMYAQLLPPALPAAPYNPQMDHQAQQYMHQGMMPPGAYMHQQHY